MVFFSHPRTHTHICASTLAHSLTRTPSRTHACTYSRPHALTHAIAHSRTHSRTYSRTCSLAHSLPHSFAGHRVSNLPSVTACHSCALVPLDFVGCDSLFAHAACILVFANLFLLRFRSLSPTDLTLLSCPLSLIAHSQLWAFSSVSTPVVSRMHSHANAPSLTRNVTLTYSH